MQNNLRRLGAGKREENDWQVNVCIGFDRAPAVTGLEQIKGLCLAVAAAVQQLYRQHSGP